MHSLPLGVRRYKRHWLRGRDIALRDPRRSASPTSEELLLCVGALVAAALLLNLAATIIARGLGH